MKRRVLLVEDDYAQRTYLRHVLEDRCEAAVETKSCEWEFQRDFDAIASDPPDVAVLDIMLRWASPSREMLEPPDGVTPRDAGLRCAKRLREDPRTRDIKVILYSVLPKDEFGDTSLPENTIYIVKELDCHNLIEKVKEVSA